MHGAAVVFSSARSHWRTPPALWRPLVAECGITIDVCAEAFSAIVPRYFGPDHPDPNFRDALACAWGEGEVCFMNPPFSREEGIDVAPFVQAAQLESEHNTVVALLPSRTDTRWWHRYVMPHADEVRFIPHRVQFLNVDGTTPPASAGFPSAIVIWRPRWKVVGRMPRFVSWDYQ